MKYIIIAYCCLLLFSSCIDNGQNRNSETITIEDFETKQITLEDIISSIDVFVLKTPDNDPIGQINDVCFIKDNMYVLDKMTSSVFAFDFKRKEFIKKITDRGNGPNEYVFPTKIRSDRSSLYLMDLPTQRIICYSPELEPYRTVQLPCSAFDFIPIENGFLLYNIDRIVGSYAFVDIDGKGKIRRQYKPLEAQDMGKYDWGTEKSFSVNDNEHVCSEFFSNQFYRIRKDSLEPQFIMNFAGKNIPKDMNINDINIHEQELYAYNVDFFILPNLFINSFFWKNKRYYNFHNRISKENQTGFINNKNSNIPFYPQWQYKNLLIGACSFEDIKDYLISTTTNDGQNLVKEDEDWCLIFFTPSWP